ncbi:PTS system mannose/fructose/sorbose family transporter subunit IID [Enterococcus faecium]|nr:PTS system mannose/fructose/sorbose family transporter subunit IID [Enterococcus faecium]EKC6747715.1 PTS system mannose/fructose/sorbose family transporter subunit IID [Enterococcus faecium]EKY7859919.1 PTS system mannose/fructose/sorbose family transporter subunit IID [Enterococcus faecium]EKY7934805.1 PTS system mannose/fructose/sorbose family transporter subunit IID [Enterococcus faecium]EKY7958165.1 PTS system mannose/fructose/sorbose family transporter subunit IID [Enterococcus faecium
MNKKLTKIDKQVIFRWILNGATSLNYEKMEGLGYAYSMLPFIKDTYKDDPEGMKQSVLAHLQFFNTTPYTAPYIIGMNVGIEKEEKNKSLEAVSALKTGLMGPLAGIGDSVFVVIPWTIFGAIAANMALEGSFVGIILWILASILLRITAYPLYLAGKESGASLLTQIETKLKSITDAVSILGLMVVGALIATVVKVNVGFEFKQGDLTMTGNEIFDQVMPGLLPACVVAIVYYLLGRKVKPVYVILLILVVFIALRALNILK